MTSQLQDAALAMLEEGLAFAVHAEMKKRLPEEQPEPQPAVIHPVLRARVLYLIGLEQQMEAGLFHARLWADELLGLAALRAARREFQAAHAECPHCGAPQRADDTLCWRCFEKNEREEVVPVALVPQSQFATR